MKLTDEDGLLWYRVSGGCEGDPKREKKNQPSENKKSSCYCKNIQAVAHNRLYLKQCYSNFTLQKLFQ